MEVQSGKPREMFSFPLCGPKSLRLRSLEPRRCRSACATAGRAPGQVVEPDRARLLAIRYSEPFHGDGQAFFAAAVKHGLEGIVSKMASSPYRSGPSKAWRKTKNVTESEFVL